MVALADQEFTLAVKYAVAERNGRILDRRPQLAFRLEHGGHGGIKERHAAGLLRRERREGVGQRFMRLARVHAPAHKQQIYAG